MLTISTSKIQPPYAREQLSIESDDAKYTIWFSIKPNDVNPHSSGYLRLNQERLITLDTREEAMEIIRSLCSAPDEEAVIVSIGHGEYLVAGQVFDSKFKAQCYVGANTISEQI